jgi:hypothetical protein
MTEDLCAAALITMQLYTDDIRHYHREPHPLHLRLFRGTCQTARGGSRNGLISHGMTAFGNSASDVECGIGPIGAANGRRPRGGLELVLEVRARLPPLDMTRAMCRLHNVDVK